MNLCILSVTSDSLKILGSKICSIHNITLCKMNMNQTWNLDIKQTTEKDIACFN